MASKYPQCKSTNTALLGEIEEATKLIRTAADLVEYAQAFPSPPAGILLQEAIAEFKKHKIKSDGSRDGKLIWEHIQLGFGKRLTDEEVLEPPPGVLRKNELVIGLMLWSEKYDRPERFSYRERTMHKKDYGTENPMDLLRDFVLLLKKELMS